MNKLNKEFLEKKRKEKLDGGYSNSTSDYYGYCELIKNYIKNNNYKNLITLDGSLKCEEFDVVKFDCDDNKYKGGFGVYQRLFNETLYVYIGKIEELG